MREKLFSITLKDCEVQTFRAGGAGGQNQNKRSTGVRVIHRASGARGECRTHRTQYQNKCEAFRRMAKSQKFQRWCAAQANDIKQKVEEQMEPKKVTVEVFKDGDWVLYEEAREMVARWGADDE